jgi:hypothetical protein
MRRSELALGLAFALALGGFAAGCSSDKVTVTIASDDDCNGGKPFYVVMRQIEEATYVTDSYETIVTKVFSSPPDPTVVKSEVIFPGVKSKLVVQKNQTVPLAIYFLFATPGERWKISKPSPVPSSIDIELGKNDIKADGG